MSEEVLSYNSPWYAYGDADKLPFAIAYGLVAMATVWVIEALSSVFIAHDPHRLTVMDVASFVAFRGASWFQLFKMACRRRSRGDDQLYRAEQSRPKGFKKRFTFSLVLRVFITIAEITVIVLAVPNSIPVHEHEVGSTELTLQKTNNEVQRLTEVSSMYPCMRDEIMYDGFNPNVIRDICWLERKTFTALPENQFSATYNNTSRLFELVSGNGAIAFGHFLRRTEKEPFVLSMSASILDEAYELLIRVYGKRTNRCKLLMVTVNRERKAIQGTCDGKKRPSVYDILLEFEKNFYTRRILGKNVNELNTLKAKFNGDPVAADTKINIGTANRPELCLIPAIILLTVLCGAHLCVKVFCKRESVEMSLYHHSETCPDFVFEPEALPMGYAEES